MCIFVLVKLVNNNNEGNFVVLEDKYINLNIFVLSMMLDEF